MSLYAVSMSWSIFERLIIEVFTTAIFFFLGRIAEVSLILQYTVLYEKLNNTNQRKARKQVATLGT